MVVPWGGTRVRWGRWVEVVVLPLTHGSGVPQRTGAVSAVGQIPAACCEGWTRVGLQRLRDDSGQCPLGGLYLREEMRPPSRVREEEDDGLPQDRTGVLVFSVVDHHFQPSALAVI